MKTRPKIRPSAGQRPATVKGRARPATRPAEDPSASINAYRGGDTARTSLGTKAKAAMPTEQRDAFALCTEYAFRAGSRLVPVVLRVATAYLNFGLRFVGADGRALKPEVKDWLRPIEWRVRRLIANAWRHRLVYGNVVAVWYTDAVARQIAGDSGYEPEVAMPMLARPEAVRYSDLWGQETLKWTPAVTDGGTLPKVWLDRAGKDLAPGDEDFGFAVFKLGPEGEGLDWPLLAEVFAALWQIDCMDAGEAALAMASRLLTRQHKLGFDKRYGPSAGSANFHYKEERGARIRQAFQSHEGVMDYTGNFDHEVVLAGLVEPKYFDARKYADAVNRVLDWVRPFGRLGLAPATLPYLASEARAVAQEERSVFGGWLEALLQQSLQPPGSTAEEPALRLRWSQACFTDPRISWEISKYAAASGGLSQRTVVEDLAGQSDEAEMAAKLTERAERAARVPLYDTAHGPTQVKGTDDTGGRPAGTRDPAGGG